MREGSSVLHVYLPFITLISMKSKSRLALLVATTVIFPALQAFAQEGPLDPAQPKGITADEVIQRFAAKEKEFKAALDLYAYRQTVKVQTVDGDTVDGEYAQTFDVTFDDQGHKVKTVVYAPESSLQRISMTQEDVDDIENRLPFVLTSDEIPEYDILYAGQQQEDELHCYVFDIAPKKIEGKKRYFQGRIWVDDHDFQIVKTYGKTVPDIRKKKSSENLFPKFTTWREQIDGKYWFPTYTKADDTLHFSNQDVHIREIVKYTNYQRFRSKVKVTYEGKEVPGAPPQQKPDQPQ
jgi:outer membrane lipoprotein-sorting protein